MLKEQPQFPCLFVLHRLWTWMIIARPLTSSTLMEVVTGQSAHKFGIWESDIIRLCKFVIRLAPTSHTQFPFLNPHRSQTSTIHPKKGRRLTVQLIWEELTGLGFLGLKHLMYATLQHYNILGWRGGLPNCSTFLMSSIMFINEFVWMYRTVFFLFFAFRCGAKHILFWYQSPGLCKMFINFLINSTFNFSKCHVENNPYRGSRVCSFSIASVFSEPSCIYICLAGMNFVFDKGHVAHKGRHDHFNPQVFVNKQGR